MDKAVVKTFVVVALAVALIVAVPKPAAAQTPVTVRTVAELQAAVAAAAGSTVAVDIRLRAGTYDLPSLLDLSVAAGASATLRNFGDGQVILTSTSGGSLLRTGFLTRRGAYTLRGLTLSGADTAVIHDAGDIRIEDSTFIDNVQGFYVDSSTANVTIRNSTFMGNGTRCGEGSSNCGAIWLDFYNSVTLTNLTVAGAGNGVGIYGLGFGSATTLANSLIAFNQMNCGGGTPGTTATNNIVDEPGSGCPGSTVINFGFQYPGFGDHGGVVFTWPLTWDVTVPSSNPAVGGGDPASCPSHDARGALRKSPCDVGAYESGPLGFTVESATGAGPVTFQTAPGVATFGNFHALDPSALPNTGLPPSVTFPFGVFEWHAILTAGPALPVAITFPTPVSSPVQYWKLSPLTLQWFDLCQLIVCTLSPDQRTLTFTITDGGAGDVDLVLGSIHDPGGLGVDGNAPPAPNVALSKTLMSPGVVGNGAVVTYRVTATNVGAGPTTGVITVTDVLHPALTFLPGGSDPRCAAAGQVVTCVASPPLATGLTETFDLSVQVAAGAAPVGGSIQIPNTATGSTPGDADASDDTSNVATLVVHAGTPTPTGTAVTVQPTDLAGVPQPLTLTFSAVTAAGYTTAIPSTVGPPLPPNFSLNGALYDIATTAQYTPPITVCFGGRFIASDRVLHYENGQWVVLPNQQLAPPGGPYTQICAETASLSPFAVATLNTPPTLTLPADITAEAASAAGSVVAFTATANDAEDGVLAATCTPGSGAVFPLGTTTVTCGATDANGASVSGTFAVTVIDTTPPAITTPGAITQTASTTSGAVVTFAVTANDLVSGAVTPACAPASGTLFPVGTTTVTCSAQDAAGNGATAAFAVTVLPPNDGTQAPTLTGILPDSGRRGTYQLVLLQGTGMRRKLTVNFSDGGIKVIEAGPLGTNAAWALVYIQPTAVRGPRAVTVSNTNGSSNALTFVVR